MLYYKTKIVSPICIECRVKAAYKIFNIHNAFVGYFCNRHVERKLKHLNEKGSDAVKGLRKLVEVP